MPAPKSASTVCEMLQILRSRPHPYSRELGPEVEITGIVISDSFREPGPLIVSRNSMVNPSPTLAMSSDPKQDANYVFYELTRSICPECRRVIDAHVLIRDNKVYMRKRCPDHGMFEGLVYGDAQLYTNHPGSTSRARSRWSSPRKWILGALMTADCARTISNTPAWALSKSTAPAIWPARYALPRRVPDSA